MKGSSMNILIALFLFLILGVLMSVYQSGADSMAENTDSTVAKTISNLIPAALVVGALFAVLKIIQFAFRPSTPTY